MSTVAQLAVAATGFAIVAAIAQFAPRALRSASPLVVGLAAGAAIGGSIAADAAASGASTYDAVLRVLVGLAFVAAGCYCSAGARLASAAILVVVSLLGSGDAWPAAAALGASLAAVVLDDDGPALGAVTGFVLGQGALRLDWPSVTGVSTLLGLTAFLVVAVPALAHVHRRTRRLVVVGALVGVGVVFVLGVIWGATALTVRNDLSTAVDQANEGLDAARAGDTDLAAERLDVARNLFARAQDRLDAWWAQPIRAVPVAAQNARALRVMTRAGRELAETGADTARNADPDDVRPRNGTVPLDELRALDAPLSTAADALERARTDLGDIESPWLVSILARKLDTLDAKVARAARDAETARIAVEVVPKLLGGEGDRRYFVAFQTPAEQRSNGGLIGNFAEITYQNGDISLARNARDSDWNRGNRGVPRTLVAPEGYKRRYGNAHPENIIQNVTLSPDFPSVAQVIEGVYPQTGGQPVDGVISMDPIALAQFLRLTGSVRVPGYDVELTADNAADILLQQQYVMFPDSEVRAEFLKAVVRAVFDRLENVELPGPKEIGNILGPMAREGRLQLHSAHPDEQAFFRRIGAAREFPDPAGDFLAVVTQNGTGNKIDVFQHRSVRYEARVDPSTGALEATATIAVRNDAPASGLPDYIIGSFPDNPLPRGTSRLLVWVYSPEALESALLDGAPVDLIAQRELGHNVYMAQFDVPPGGTRTLTLELRGGVNLQRSDGEYRLKVWRQATVNPDRTRVAVSAAPGWTVKPRRGLRATPNGAARGGDQSSLLAVSAAFARN